MFTAGLGNDQLRDVGRTRTYGHDEDEADVTGEGSAGAIIRKPFTNDALLLRIRGLLDAGQSAGTPSIFTPG